MAVTMAGARQEDGCMAKTDATVVNEQRAHKRDIWPAYQLTALLGVL
jgi:hypothetical protein